MCDTFLRSRKEHEQFCAETVKWNRSRVIAPLPTLTTHDFKSVFCVCHTPEDSEVTYVECSFALGGCQGWLHPSCVGIASKSAKDLRYMGRFICPFCVAYLEASGELSVFADKDTT